MAVTYSFVNLDVYIRDTGRILAQRFVSDSIEGAIEYIEVKLSKTTLDPSGSVYAMILEADENGNPGKTLAISTPELASTVIAAGGTVRFDFSAADEIPVNTAMFFAIAHQGPVKYLDEVATNNDLITNGGLTWAGAVLTGWDIIDNPSNSVVSDASPGVSLAKTSAGELILPTIVQRGILEVGRSYEARIVVDETTWNEGARIRLLVHTLASGSTIDFMEDPYNSAETLCRIRFVAQGSDFYITVNDMGTAAVPVTNTQIFTDVKLYPLDGDNQRLVNLGVDNTSPSFADGKLWIKEPGVPWVEDTNQAAVFIIEFQPTSAVTADTLDGQIDDLSWSLTASDHPGEVTSINIAWNNLIARWETIREKIIQVDNDSAPSQANWETSWVNLGESLPIPTGTRLFWNNPTNGFSGQWEVRNGVAQRKDKFLKGTREIYITASADTVANINGRLEVDEEIATEPQKHLWWMEGAIAGYNLVPIEFTFTLHRSAYVRLRRNRFRDVSVTPTKYYFYFTIDGHHLSPREAMDDNQGGLIAWTPGAGGGGLHRDNYTGAKSINLYTDFQYSILLPPGKHTFRYGYIMAASSSGDIAPFGHVALPPAPFTGYDTPDYWEFIYA